MKKFISAILSLIMVLSLCSCGAEPDVSELVINGTEKDEYEVYMQKHLMTEESCSEWSDRVSTGFTNDKVLKLKETDTSFIVTVSKETFNSQYVKSAFESMSSESLSEIDTFDSLSFSDDLLTANLYVDTSVFYPFIDYGIVRTVYKDLSIYTGFFNILEPNITINIYDKETKGLLYSFNHTRPTERIIDISAKELVTAYTKNEESADEQYNGKYLDVTGEVADVELDTNGLPGWILVKPETGYSVCWVQCNLNESAYDRAAQFKEGDIITVLGQCSGQTLHIQLDDCVVY